MVQGVDAFNGAEVVDNKPAVQRVGKVGRRGFPGFQLTKRKGPRSVNLGIRFVGH